VFRKKYQLLLSALVLVGTLLTSFHYHDDSHADEDCSVCIVQQVFEIADIPELITLQVLILFFFIPLTRRQHTLSLDLIHVAPSRAPPSFF